MKQVFTRSKKANRGPSKTANGIYAMSVIQRRTAGIRSSDSNLYDLKHGISSHEMGTLPRIRRAPMRKRDRRDDGRNMDGSRG